MGSLPPGLHEPQVKDVPKRNYSNSWPAVYLLRPEVIMKFWITDMLTFFSTVERLYILWKMNR
jgi:hypothetical protein